MTFSPSLTRPRSSFKSIKGPEEAAAARKKKADRKARSKAKKEARREARRRKKQGWAAWAAEWLGDMVYGMVPIPPWEIWNVLSSALNKDLASGAASTASGASERASGAMSKEDAYISGLLDNMGKPKEQEAMLAVGGGCVFS